MKRTIAALVLVSVASVAACSSNSDGDNTGTGTCTAPGNSDSDAGTDVNPDGVAYPVPPAPACYGRTARTGSTPGSIIANFKFQGYVNGDVSQGLTTISLADYYDPCNKRYKMIHLSVAAVWCVPCGQETDAFVAAQSSLASQGIVVLQALDDGPSEGMPATVSDLQYWIMQHNSNFTEMLDPGLTNFGGFFDAASVPWNADLDPRTMELLDSSEGFSGSAQSEVQSGLSAMPATPSYPIPASAGCN